MLIKINRSYNATVSNVATYEQLRTMKLEEGQELRVKGVIRNVQDRRSGYPHQINLVGENEAIFMHEDDFEEVLPLDERPTMKMPTLDISNGSRNYNLNKKLDAHTHDFERRLDMLCKEYGVYMETETFHK